MVLAGSAGSRALCPSEGKGERDSMTPQGSTADLCLPSCQMETLFPGSAPPLEVPPFSQGWKEAEWPCQ